MKKLLGTIFILTVSIIVGTIVKVVGERATARSRPSAASQIEEGFRSSIAQFKKLVPYKLDDVTTMVDVDYFGTVLTYFYRIDTDNYEVQPNYVELARQAAIKSACWEESMRKAIRAGAIYRYSYTNSQSKSLGTFELNAVSCGLI
jgi:hypothetical protein